MAINSISPMPPASAVRLTSAIVCFSAVNGKM